MPTRAALTLAIICLALGFILGNLFCMSDPFDQRNFACQEDEYLAFSFTDSDRLECFHIEES